MGVWHKENSKWNKSLKISGENQTNQKAELVAIIEALKGKTKRELKIISDSKTCLEGITKHLTSWEDKDWLDITNAKEWRYLAYLLRTRTEKTKFK